MTDLSPHATALQAATRRPLAINTDTTIRANFTHSRAVTLTVEPDGEISAWAEATIDIGGRVVVICVLLGDVLGQLGATKQLGRARVLVAEVIASGSRAARFHGEGTMPDGRRAFIYSANQLYEPLVAARVASFVARNAITLSGADKAPAKVAKLAKSRAA